MIGGLAISPLERADRARHFDSIGGKCITRGGTELNSRW
jgi:hypothetical protein